jgi:hypothetical protein
MGQIGRENGRGDEISLKKQRKRTTRRNADKLFTED